MPFSNALSLGTIGLKARDLPWFAFEKADVVICVGYDMVEYHPDMWNPNGDKIIIHIDALPAEVDEHYIVAVGVLGDIGDIAARHRAAARSRSRASPFKAVRKAHRRGPRASTPNDTGFPVKPQKIVWDLREVLGAGRHRRSPTSARTRCGCRACTAPSGPTPASSPTASRRWASRCRARIAAKLAYPDRKVVAVTGDAGFMMNSQEIETALRMKTPFVILIWNDSEYGLITWHQLRHFGRPSHIAFKNPDFVKYAESFGAKGYRVETRRRPGADARSKAFADNTVVIIDCPVDYSREHEAHRAAEEPALAALNHHQPELHHGPDPVPDPHQHRVRRTQAAGGRVRTCRHQEAADRHRCRRARGRRAGHAARRAAGRHAQCGLRRHAAEPERSRRARRHCRVQ